MVSLQFDQHKMHGAFKVQNTFYYSTNNKYDNTAVISWVLKYSLESILIAASVLEYVCISFVHLQAEIFTHSSLQKSSSSFRLMDFQILP